MPTHAQVMARIKANLAKAKTRQNAALAKRKSRAAKKASKSKKSKGPIGLKALGLY